jgi:mono/diheme cytochrome c family protein
MTMRGAVAVFAIAVVAIVACGSPDRPRRAPAASTAPPPDEPLSDPLEYKIDRVTRAAGEAIFVRTGIGDPYRTGMAYPVFLALLRAFPDELGGDVATLTEKFGFTARAADPASADLDLREGLPVGMHLTTDPNTGVAWLVASCAVCHAERVRWPGGEQLVIGLGNKRIRIHDYDAAITNLGRRADFDRTQIAKVASQLAIERGLAWPIDWQAPIINNTIDGLRKRARAREGLLKRVAGGPPGRVAPIESFAVAFEQHLGHPVMTGDAVGWTKIADVIGFPVRTTLSWDGATQGSIDALVVEADFAAGARPSWFWDHPLQGPSLSAYLRRPAPRPPFPGKIDRARAKRGQALFVEHCSSCHGSYAADGTIADYEEQVVPLETIGTDAARADGLTPDFVRAANTRELTHGIVETRASGGYVPPVLTNIWARAPYGHLGQWPTLAFLATPPAKRATRYAIDLDAPLDLDAVGVRVVPESTAGAYVHDGTRPGLGVAGHPFLAELGAADAALVIEYLKTL